MTEEVDMAEQEKKTPKLYDNMVTKMITATWQTLDERLDVVRLIGIDIEAFVIFANIGNAKTEDGIDLPIKLACNPELPPHVLLKVMESVSKSLNKAIEEAKEKV